MAGAGKEVYMTTKTVLYALTVITLLAMTLGCGTAGKSAARRLMKAEGRAADARATSVLRRDLVRDRATPARSLPRGRTVFRYTSDAEARRELASSVRPGNHMTSRGGAGRPLGAAVARKRYGLPREPEVRMSIWLERGTKVRKNKALGGERGVGEITPTQTVPARSIKKVVKLKE